MLHYDLMHTGVGVLYSVNYFLFYLQRKLSSAEIILDHDIYQSDEGLPTLGQSTTQGGTLPLQYSTDRWEEIQHRLDFVGMQEPQDDGNIF